MALEPKASPVREDTQDNTASITETRPVPEPAHSPEGLEETSELEKGEKKMFQAFNIKPLRQKLPNPVNLDELKKRWAEQETGGEAEREGESQGGEETPHPAAGQTTSCFCLMCQSSVCISCVPGEEEEREDGGEAEQKSEAEVEEKMCSCCSEETDGDDKEKPKKTCPCRRESSASSEDSSLISPDKVGLKSLVCSGTALRVCMFLNCVCLCFVSSQW